jgi:site-specific DNA-methyltransferase (adenine-specific)
MAVISSSGGPWVKWPPGQDKKKGADSGVDGYIYFFDDNSGKAKKIIVQVKSGHVKRGDIATLKGDMDREKAELGAFLTLEKPTRPMIEEAATAGFYTSDSVFSSGIKYPRIQILTIEDLLSGKKYNIRNLEPSHLRKQNEKVRWNKECRIGCGKNNKMKVSLAWLIIV